MIVVTRQLITIDSEVTVLELLDQWKNGNITDVIDKLAADHAGLTAFFITQGAKDKVLALTDCNIIVNRLIDRRAALAQSV